VAIEETKGPLRLVVSKTHAAGIHGVVVDEAGQPVPQADVYLTAWSSQGSTQSVFGVTGTRCDAQGRFEIRGLWSGDYELQFGADDFERQRQPKFKLQPGQSLDLGKIALDSARRAIEGAVVDSAGKPIEGVEVFQSGDAPQRLSARTDKRGRFQMQGFCAGPAYLFAQQPGYRFRAVLAEAGAKDVTIRLLRGDEPLPPRPPAKQLSQQQRHKLARSMLEKCWAGGNHAMMYQAVAAMALIDPDQAKRWTADLDPRSREVVPMMAAVTAADADIEEMLSLLPADSSRAVMLLRHVAERWATDDPAKALRCAEEGIVRTRSLDAPARAQPLAAFGGLVARLGQPEAGRKLVEEAAQIATRLPASPTGSFARGKVATAMAAFDLKRAVDLLAPIADQNQRHAWLPQVTAAASVSQPEQARALWAGLEPWYLSRAKAATAYRLAETRSDEALQLVESIEGDDAPVQKVESLGWIAESVARRDKAKAWAILDRALALAMAPRAGTDLARCRDLPVKAAMLAVHARRIGYPDLQSVCDRVLASRPPFRAVSPERALESSLGVAVILAAADPETARPLLHALEPHAAQFYAGEDRRMKSQWFIGWALADPEHAAELADRRWAAGSKTPGWDIAGSGILNVPFVFALPESERFEIAVSEMAGLGVSVAPRD
jgi:hypothetical protein